MIKVNIFWEVRPKERIKIEKKLNRFFKSIEWNRGLEVSANVIFVAKERIRGLNGIYRGKAEVTDVLSFNIGDKEAEGDIFIAFQTAAEQSILKKNSLEEELKRLIIHGILHLAGYGHQTTKEWKKMEAQSAKIMDRAGGFTNAKI